MLTSETPKEAAGQKDSWPCCSQDRKEEIGGINPELPMDLVLRPSANRLRQRWWGEWFFRPFKLFANSSSALCFVSLVLYYDLHMNWLFWVVGIYMHFLFIWLTLIQNFPYKLFLSCVKFQICTVLFSGYASLTSTLILLVTEQKMEKAQSREDLTCLIKTDGNINEQCRGQGLVTCWSKKNTLDLAWSLWGGRMPTHCLPELWNSSIMPRSLD